MKSACTNSIRYNFFTDRVLTFGTVYHLLSISHLSAFIVTIHDVDFTQFIKSN